MWVWRCCKFCKFASLPSVFPSFLVFSVHHIYITYGAPACTTCLFILNLSKNSHLCFAIVSESGCKGKRFYRNRQMFSKVFLKKFFFETSIKGGRPSSPGLIRSRSLSPAKVRYWVQTAVKENSPTFVSPSQSHTVWSAASLSIADAKVDLLTITSKHTKEKLSGFPETFL